MEYLASQKKRLGLHELARERTSMQGGRSTTSLVDSFVYGRDDDKQQIVDAVLMDVTVGEHIPVIPIIGMGGIGKTTLAKMVYNDKKVDDYFHVRVWVCVAEEFDVFRITKTILQTVTSNHSSDITELNLLQLELKKMLTGKKLLLVLDDVWNEDYSKWCMLCDPFTTVSPGSKIIATTRNHCVASIMRTVPSDHSLKPLSNDASWSLFKNHAFGKSGVGHPQLEVIGKQVVEKCKGLPLAIKLLGGALRNKVDAKDWENVVKSEFWDLPICKTSILPALRLSYHFLPAHLKPCFAYCSIFPRDYEFDKKKLILLWMAEGFVINKIDKSMEEFGEEYFDELVSRSFFQKSCSPCGTFFVMHGLNNDLARDVSGKFCLTLEESKTSEFSEKVRHILWSQNNVNDYNKLRPLQNAKYLRTFLPMRKPFSYDHHLSFAILRGLMQKLSCIRVLSLSLYSSFDELPDSVCTLVHLRYLDLSHTFIQSLPDTIRQLYNLQTLNLSHCPCLVKLPSNLWELVNLRHLDISETLLKKLPPRIRKLESLQSLSNFIVGEGNCSGLGELNGLRHLKGSLSISGLHNVKYVKDAIEANVKGKMGIEQLSFAWSGVAEVSNNNRSILDKLQPSTKLNHLTILDYGGMQLSSWLGDGSLSNLTYLKISNCVHCVSLPSLGQLPSLVELHFECMDSVKRVDSDFYGNKPSSVKPFAKLVILKFEFMPKWEEWSPSGGNDFDDFPKLEMLSIEYCPKLNGSLPKFLPSLRDLCIVRCSELTDTFRMGASARSLKLKKCKNVVFENNTNLSSLISLEIGDLESHSFPIGMMENCNNLEVLKITYWSSLTHFSDEGLPTTLKELGIWDCNNLLFIPRETFHKYRHLSALMLFGSCDSMTSFPLGLFPNLKSLAIISAKNLESFSIEDEDHENLKSLQSLKIWECDKLTNFPSGGLETPNLVTLSVRKCKNLKFMPEGMHTQLTSLQSLIIHDCEEVESFPAGGLPSSLGYLCIINCKKVMEKKREWDLHTLSSLNHLTIGGCEDIESFPEAQWQLPSSITRLLIWTLPNLKTIDAGRLPSLQILDVYDCPKAKFCLPVSFISLTIKECPLMAMQLQSKKIYFRTLNHDQLLMSGFEPIFI